MSRIHRKRRNTRFNHPAHRVRQYLMRCFQNELHHLHHSKSEVVLGAGE